MGLVTVKSKFGNMQAIEESDLQNALKHGFNLASDEEVQSHNDEIEHGSGLLNPAMAFAEEAASTASFGVSRELENLSGLTTPEAQEARAKYNPIAHIAGIPAGILADPLGAVGQVSKLGTKVGEGAAKLIGKAPAGAGFFAKAAKNVPRAAAAFGAEGAVYGVGQSVAEHALGDPDLNAEKIMSNIGYGSLIAGGLGGALEGGFNLVGKSTLKSSIADEIKAQSFQNDISEGVDTGIVARETLAKDAPFKEFPKSLEEINQAVKDAGPLVPDGLPSGGRLKEAVENLPDLQFKPHNLQYESLSDQGMRDYYKTFLESQSEDAKAIRDYEALQKHEALTKLDDTFKEISGGSAPIADPVKGGQSALSKFTDQYEKEKEALGPLFKQFDEIATNKKINPLDSLLKLQDIFPNIGEYLNADAEGVFKLNKYSPSMPFSKNTYKAIKDLVQVSNEEGLTLSKLRAVRESMRDRLTLNAASRDFAQIGAIRKALMDEMEAHVSAAAPSLEVRDTFMRYAKNEAQRGIIEKILGGAIGDKASFAKKIKPEDVLNKIFSNTVSVGAAKEILGNDFNKVLADYLQQNRAKVFDQVKGGFSSNRFATFLKSKRPEIYEAMNSQLSGIDSRFNRIQDLTDYMRILPDAPSTNPSGTAKTLNILEKMAGLSKFLKPAAAIEDFANRLASKESAKQQRYTMAEVLAGKNLGAAKERAEAHFANSSRLARIGRYAEDTAQAITENVKAVFDTAAKVVGKSVGVTGSKLAPSNKKKSEDGASLGKHHDIFAKINELQNDPEKMMSDLEKAVASVYPHAPGIAQGIQTAAVRATQFLASKIPPQPAPSAFSKETFEPSKQELAQFEGYLNIIEDPIHTLSKLKDHSITPDDVEALNVVYPKIYQAMQVALIEQASDFSAKKNSIPHGLKQALSIFMQSPIDESFSTQAIQANQMAFMVPQQQASPPKSGMDKMTVGKRTGLNHGSNLDA